MTNNTTQDTLTVREFLTQIAKREGWWTEDTRHNNEVLAEIVEDVYTGDRDPHRWYIAEETVVEVEGRYIKYWAYITTGDNSMSDMGLAYDVDDMDFVERKEKVVTEVCYV